MEQFFHQIGVSLWRKPHLFFFRISARMYRLFYLLIFDMIGSRNCVIVLDLFCVFVMNLKTMIYLHNIIGMNLEKFNIKQLKRPWLTTLVLGQTGLFSKPIITQKCNLYLQIHQLMGQLLTLGDHSLPPTSKEILAFL